MKWWLVGLAAAVIGAGAGTTDARAAVSETGTTPYAGVYHGVITDPAVPVKVHVIEVDLSSAEIRLRATAEGERGQKTATWASSASAAVAVNGDLFDPLDFTPAGLARGGAGGGATWSISVDDASEGFLSFDNKGGTNHASISAPELVVAAADLDPATEGVIGGRPMLVRTGVAVGAFDCDDATVIACQRAPRAAVGVSQDGRTLYIVVVDGWQAGSLGWTLAELAQFMVARGAYDALALDPGGSAGLYVAGEGGVVSAPSNGVEVPVANQLGVLFGPQPPGTLVGFIRERDVFDTTADIAGATVKLDSGQTDVTGADGLYTFPGIPPRYTCATASAPGYHSATQCRQVKSGLMEYNSIALFPNADFIDAGPGQPDGGGVVVVDAAPLGDTDSPPLDGTDVDASDDPGSPSTCGCRAGGRRGASSLALLACVLAGFAAMLRRGRKPRG